MNFIKTLLKRKWVMAALGIIIIFGGYYGYKVIKGNGAGTRYITSAVTKGTITSSVSGTGQVAATNQVDIKPSDTGQITSVRVKQGDTVKTGQTLATLDNRNASAGLAQAQASFATAQANYQKVLEGAAGSDVATAQLNLTSVTASASASIANAKQALIDAQSNLPIVMTQQNRAVNLAQSNMYNAGLTASPSDTLSTTTITLSGTYSGTTEGQYKITFYQTGNGTYYNVAGLANQDGQLNRGLAQPIGNGLYMTVSTTGTISTFTTSWTVDVPNKTSSSYTSANNAYQTALDTQTQTIKTANDAIPKAQMAYDQAQAQANNQIAAAQNTLTNLLAPADKAALLSSQASVKQAQANLVTAQTNYSNTNITAPFDGVVAALSAQKGDQASSATALATITTAQKVAEISLNEVDVAKVKVGQKATLSFSAVDNLTITGQVGEVDSIGAITQNVVSFKVKILFDTQDDRIKPGMSVSAAIITDIKQDVLTVPSSAVKVGGGQSYVETLVNGAPVQHQVTAGLASDTDTEVSGDIKEGDQVVTQTITASTAKTTTQSSSILQSLGAGGGARAGGAAASGFGGAGGAARGGN